MLISKMEMLAIAGTVEVREHSKKGQTPLPAVRQNKVQGRQIFWEERIRLRLRRSVA